MLLVSTRRVMSNETAMDLLLAALPEDGTSLSNKKLQDKLTWPRAEYERVRELLLQAKRVKKAPGKGGSLRRVLGAARDDADEAGSVDGVSMEESDESDDGDSEEAAATPMPAVTNPKEEFALQLHVDLESRRSAGRLTYEQALVEYAIESFGDEQFEEPYACTYVDVDSFSGEARLRIDGYDLHEDDDDDRDLIDLFVVHAASPVSPGLDGKPSISIPVFEGAPVNALFRAVRRFVEESRRNLHLELTSDPEARDVARSIKASKNLARVNINLITNAEVRQFDRTVETVDRVEIVKRVLDINYLRRLLLPDSIEVDFSAGQPGGIPCVPLPDKNGAYRSFLAVVPGTFLFQLYDKYKQRLLEANVRSYLRANNKSVNHGIIETIRERPEMFFAYNNGITATADELVVDATPEGGWALVRCRNLQIVNGGQTTASLFHANLRKIPLDKVFVSMKINEVIDRSRAAEVVQKISYYANSQNKVNFSDLGANQGFHVKLQKLAQEEVPPVPALARDVFKGSQWFYERMRGQYQNAVALELTKARKRDYQRKYPKSQVLTKTDVARYSMIWDQRPYDVCFGSEKNYVRFLKRNEPNFEPDAAWFRALIAKVILTERCDAIVYAAKIPGYKSNIVAYTVALLSRVRGKELDLETIWREQKVDETTEKWMESASVFVRAHITAPATEGKNVGEWSKKEECWKSLLTAWAAKNP